MKLNKFAAQTAMAGALGAAALVGAVAAGGVERRPPRLGCLVERRLHPTLSQSSLLKRCARKASSPGSVEVMRSTPSSRAWSAK